MRGSILILEIIVRKARAREASFPQVTTIRRQSPCNRICIQEALKGRHFFGLCLTKTLLTDKKFLLPHLGKNISKHLNEASFLKNTPNKSPQQLPRSFSLFLFPHLSLYVVPPFDFIMTHQHFVTRSLRPGGQNQHFVDLLGFHIM